MDSGCGDSQGTSDIITLAAAGSNTNSKCIAGIGWMELV